MKENIPLPTGEVRGGSVVSKMAKRGKQNDSSKSQRLAFSVSKVKETSTMRQTTIDKFFGFTSSTKVEKSVVEIVSEDSDSSVFVTSAAVASEKKERPLPATLLTSSLLNSSAKRKCRFETLEELEASYSRQKPSTPSKTQKVAPVFLRAKKEKLEESVNISSVVSSSPHCSADVKTRADAILSDCFVTAVDSLPSPPSCTAVYTEHDKTIPFSHVVPGTSFVVDYFGTNNYSSVFLSHFHYDHYKGLTNSFTKKIYCSEDTARLVIQSFQKLSQRPTQQVIGLPVEQWSVVDGVPVLLLEAFHCPGAVCFVFRIQNRYCFHSGDFRAGLFIERYASALRSLCHINTAFIDTTYCDPVYDFPPQYAIIRSVLETCTSGTNPIVSDPRCLVVVGTYTIGKECVFAALGRLLDSPICVASAKLRLIRCFLLPDKKSESYCNRLLSPCTLTTVPNKGARVHVLPMAKVTWKCLPDYFAQYKHLYDRMVAFSPTGWTTTSCNTSKKSGTSGGNSSSFSLHKRAISKEITLYDVPYSEHSAFSELQRFANDVLSSPVSAYPSVFSNYADRTRIDKLLKQWLSGGDVKTQNNNK